MDNQKSKDGSGRDLGREGAGSSMGKDLGSHSGAGASSTAELHKTIDKAADAAQPVVDRLATSAHDSVDKVSGALTEASARMDEKTRQLSEAYQHFAETGRAYVRSSPATSVLLALAAGFTLAKLLSRRH
jgi:ElaB/YqjD/DUF883 family membrane-anchored ribosome-binding protein